MLLKVFDKEEYADRFMDKGEMKFTSSTKFWGYPDENHRRDRNEGLIKDKIKIPKEHANSKLTMPGMYGKVYEIDGILNAVKAVREKETGEEVTITSYGDIEISIAYYTKTFIYSTFVVDSKFISNTKLFETLRSLGNYCVLFYGDILIDALKGFIESKGSKIDHGNIVYVNDDFLGTEKVNDFNKHEKYKDQNEYRITFLPLEDHPELEYVFVSLGNISNVAQKFTVDDFMEEMRTTTQQSNGYFQVNQ